MEASTNKWVKLIPYAAILAAPIILILQITKLHSQLESMDKFWGTVKATDSLLKKTIYISPTFNPSFKLPPSQVVINNLGDLKTKLSIRDSVIFVYDTIRHDTVRINDRFLLAFPSAPKVIGGFITDSEASLDLLKTDGNLYSDKYELDFNKYDYGFSNSTLYAIKKKKKTIKKNPWANMGIYVGTGWDFSRGQYLTGNVDYNLGKFRISPVINQPLSGFPPQILIQASFKVY